MSEDKQRGLPAFPGPGEKLGGADMECPGLAGAAVSPSPWPASHWSTCQLPTSALLLPTYPPTTPGTLLKTFQMLWVWSPQMSGHFREQNFPSLSLSPFIPFILLQVQLIFTGHLLCVKNWRKNFLLILFEAFEDKTSQALEKFSLHWDYGGAAEEGWHVGKQGQKQGPAGSRSRHRFRGVRLAELPRTEMGQRKNRTSHSHVACPLNDALSSAPYGLMAVRNPHPVVAD